MPTIDDDGGSEGRKVEEGGKQGGFEEKVKRGGKRGEFRWGGGGEERGGRRGCGLAVKGGRGSARGHQPNSRQPNGHGQGQQARRGQSYQSLEPSKVSRIKQE